MANRNLQGKKVAILVTDGFEQVELLEPRRALDEAGATTKVVSPKNGTVKGWNMKEWGKEVPVDVPLSSANPDEFDALLLPGGVMNPDHLRMDHEVELAFEDYADFIDNGGGKMPATTWLELCKGAEQLQEFDRALAEYISLAKAYPSERQSLTAQLSAARLCLKKLNRPQDALAIYQAAAASPIPHLDWEQIIQSGIKEAKTALSTGNAMTAGAQ